MTCRVALVLAGLFGLTSCVSSGVQVYGQVDQNEKSITLPIGSRLLLGPIKQSLRASGWKIAVDRGPIRTVGTVGVATDLETSETFKTRYRLALRQTQFDICIGTGLPAVSYDLSVIDNNSGEEVITASGKDCIDLATRWFSQAINGGAYCAASTGRFCSQTASDPQE